MTSAKDRNKVRQRQTGALTAPLDYDKPAVVRKPLILGDHGQESSPSTSATQVPALRQTKRTGLGWMSWASILIFQVSIQDWILIAAMIFGGCCSNVFALEILVNDAPKSGQMITFAQFVCVAFEGLLRHLDWPVIQDLFSSGFHAQPTSATTSRGSRVNSKSPPNQSQSPESSDNIPAWNHPFWRYVPHLRERKIPLIRWCLIVVMFFSVSVLNNLSLAYKISVPLHIIFRSGGLMVGMVLGMLLLKKRYSTQQIFSVVIVTIGVIYATTSVKAGNTSTKPKPATPIGGTPSTGDYATGIIMLTMALVISSLMGLFQESTYKTYGAEWREGLFYSHFLALPLFFFFRDDIMNQFQIFNKSIPIPILQLVHQLEPFLPLPLASFLGKITIPKLWIFLAVNTLTQYMCISGVHRLTSLSTALTLNFILNLRKFASLLISVVYFENSFGLEMALGSSLVLLGTVMYSLSSVQFSSSSSKSSSSVGGGTAAAAAAAAGTHAPGLFRARMGSLGSTLPLWFGGRSPKSTPDGSPLLKQEEKMGKTGGGSISKKSASRKKKKD